MTADANIASLAQLAGILPRYVDMQGRERITSPDTQRALLGAIGFQADTDAAVSDSLAAQHAEAASRQFPREVIVESGQPRPLGFGTGAAWQLRRDDHADDVANGIATDAILLPALNSGVYELSLSIANHTEVVRILAAPRRLVSVETLTGVPRLWGINLALYGLRSNRNCGLGDFQDLAGFTEIAGERGAAFVGINPIHNMGFADRSISPYSPSHRGFLNTTHIALDAIPGLEHSARAHQILTRHASQFTHLRASQSVSYLSHNALHAQLSGKLFAVFLDEAPETMQSQFQVFLRDAGPELSKFAEFETLSEKYGADWRDWTDTQNAPPAPDRMQFHMWLQWVADCQLHAIQQRADAAGLSLGLYLDLAVGPRRNGAESWCEQASIATGVSIGAPPDHLSPEGQNWDLSAYAPRMLQARNYRPLRRILAQTMRHAGVVRIDHVLGLNRSFLIPDDGSPGGYVAQPFESLMAIVKIEAERHTCAVIGEDLGLVPENFRDVMRGHGFYGYSVLQYETDKDGHFPDPATGQTQVLSCFATHDTPTIKGYETGCDIRWWRHLGWIDDTGAKTAKVRRTNEVAELTRMSGTSGGFTPSVHAILAGSAASMVSIQLDDILGVTEAQNLPGTIDEHPNWRRKYDISLEEFPDFNGLHQISATMAQTRPIEKEIDSDDISNS